jgi:hypothetical protein
MRSATRFLRYTAPTTPPVHLPSLPPKTTFGGVESAEGRRIAEYMEGIRELLVLPATDAVVGLHLAVGLPPMTDLLTHHDLDNFLEPLATRIGPSRIGRASATKAIASDSGLTLGPVALAPPEPEGEWLSATLDSDGLSNPSRRRLGRVLADQAEPLPWGR